MKRIFLAVGFILIAATSTFAQTNIDRKSRKEARMERKQARKEAREERRAENRNEVSTQSKNQFAMDFPQAKDVQFVKTKNFDEVNFSSGKEELRAYYDYNNDLIGTTEKLVLTDLPEAAQKKISKDYPDYSVSRVIKFHDNGDNENDILLYGRSFDTDDFFVELRNADKAIVLEVDLSGEVSYFTYLK